MKSPREIIIAPLVTEKSTALYNANNYYTFKVSTNANKIEIKHAIERIFNVHVLNVSTIRTKGKTKRMGRFTGKRPDWKKAIVKLQPGDKIEEFEA
jgi:large subunit ribosomal protein L23